MSFLAQRRQHTVYTTNTDHLLYVCKHGCKHKTLRSKVDNTKKQSVKDQQCGLISIKQHVTEGVSLICGEKCKQTLYAHTYKQTEMYSMLGPRGHYHCKRCFFHWVQGTPFLWPSQTSACPSLYIPFQGRPEGNKATSSSVQTILYNSLRNK